MAKKAEMSKVYVLRIQPDLLREAKIEAVYLDQPASAFIRDAIKVAVEKARSKRLGSEETGQ